MYVRYLHKKYDSNCVSVLLSSSLCDNGLLLHICIYLLRYLHLASHESTRAVIKQWCLFIYGPQVSFQ